MDISTVQMVGVKLNDPHQGTETCILVCYHIYDHDQQVKLNDPHQGTEIQVRIYEPMLIL